ncbi:hypothetical protein [Reyranella sp.]|uniref:PIN-like domain-containing protein n=1 Tax=Reyranella sp. TaxID=1929291 RepID=UPI003BA9C8D8
MKVFFDNNTAPAVASTLDGFIRHSGHQALHIKDVPGLPNGRHTADVDWLNHLKNDTDAWCFITGDARLHKNPAERQALRSAGLHGFVLAPAYQKTPLHQIAASILWKWPEMLELMNLLTPPSLHVLPIGKSTKLSSLPL